MNSADGILNSSAGTHKSGYTRLLPQQAEFRAHDWIYLVAEHDTKETNVGIKLVTAELPLIPIRLNLVAKSSLDYRLWEYRHRLRLPDPVVIRTRQG